MSCINCIALRLKKNFFKPNCISCLSKKDPCTGLAQYYWVKWFVVWSLEGEVVLHWVSYKDRNELVLSMVYVGYQDRSREISTKEVCFLGWGCWLTFHNLKLSVISSLNYHWSINVNPLLVVFHYYACRRVWFFLSFCGFLRYLCTYLCFFF